MSATLDNLGVKITELINEYANGVKDEALIKLDETADGPI